MENKINIAELLCNCPSGMDLDCTMYDNLHFDKVDDYDKKIHCYIQYKDHRTHIMFGKDGTYNSEKASKCVIFPKGKTTWEGFVPPCQFKEGDIVTSKDRGLLVACIYKERKDNVSFNHHIALYKGSLGVLVHERIALTDDELRFATEEEKAKLFKAIKYKGYKWNEETKTLEKALKFKVGDRIRHKNDKTVITIIGIKGNYYLIQYYNFNRNDYQNEKVSFKDQDKYELVPNKFNINTLVPFESKVLVRVSNVQIWIPTFWGKYLKNDSNYRYLTTNGCYKYCIPYEGNEHLLGTAKDCDEFYKTW